MAQRLSLKKRSNQRGLGALLAGVAFAVLWQSPVLADKRVALVIGNSAYVNVPQLPNPANDAQDIADKLTKLGFEVISRVNVDQRGWRNIMQEFERKAVNADAALFFFAGHGMQHQGHNYLMPVDAELKDETSLRYDMISVDDIKNAFDRDHIGVKVMILDACRNNPLADSFTRSISGPTRALGAETRGLARIDKSEGMIVAYATMADEVAEDGKSTRNSPFTAALLARMDEPGIEIGTLFRRVQGDVIAKTGSKQRPELNISLASDFFLNTAETDTMAWERVREYGDTQAIHDFIAKYPRSSHYPDAKFRLDVLERAISAQAEEKRAEEDRAKAQEVALAKAKEDERQRAAKEFDDREAALIADMKAKETAASSQLAVDSAKAQQEALAKALEAERQRVAKEFANREAALVADLQAKALAASHSEDDKRKVEEQAKQGESQRVAKLERELEEMRNVRKQETQPDPKASIEREKLARDLAVKEAALDELKSQEAAAQKSAGEKERLRKEVEEKSTRDALAQIEQLKREKAEAERQLAEKSKTLAVAAANINSAQSVAPAVAVDVNTPPMVKSAQTELKRLGCYTGSISGNYSSDTLRAIVEYRRRKDGRPGSIEVTASFIDELKTQANRLCPIVCGDGEKLTGDTCIAARPAPAKVAERPPVREERAARQHVAPARERRQAAVVHPAAERAPEPVAHKAASAPMPHIFVPN